MILRQLMPVVAATIAVLPLLARWSEANASRLSEPTVHDNVVLFFVRGPSAPGPVPVTLEEALARGTVEVQETGNVQQLRIENKGAEPLFVQIGDIVKGGRQDRVITVSLLLQPGSGPVPLAAFCVEQGRWSARGREDATRFSLSADLMPSREAKVALARKAAPAAPAAPPAPAARTPAEGNAADPGAMAQRRAAVPPGADGQGEVWRSVGRMQMMLSSTLDADVAAAESRTSLQLSLENTKLKASQAAAAEAMLPAGLAGDDIIGVVVAVNGRIAGADVYVSNGLFRKMWPKLARAAAVEGLAHKADAGKAPAPTREAAEAFLAETEAAGARETRRELDGLGFTIGRESPSVLRVELRTAADEPIHRNYVAK